MSLGWRGSPSRLENNVNYQRLLLVDAEENLAPSSAIVELGSPAPRSARKSGGRPGAVTSIVQFASNITYASENDQGGAEVFMVRIGMLSSECSVRVSTGDSEHQGKKFEPIQGKQIVFKPGDFITSFRVQLYSSDFFDSVVEVQVKIDEASCVNCAPGNFLYQTRLKIIDDDLFPTNKFRSEIEKDFTGQQIKGSSSFSMLVEVAKHLISRNRGGAVRVVLADQINNVIFISQIIINREIVNQLSSDDSEYPYIVMCAVGLAVPYAITHALSYARQFWKVGGSANLCLLHPLMERFLYYEESSRALIDCAQFKHTFTQDTFSVVRLGYMQLFVLVSVSGRLAMIFAFSLYMAFQRMATSGGPALFIVSICFLVLTSTIFFYRWLRFERTSLVLSEVNHAMVDLIHHMDNCVNNYSLVAENFGRQVASTDCEAKIRALNGRFVTQSVRQANDDAFFGWLQTTSEFLMITTMGAAVVFKGMSLGNFTAALFCTKALTAQLKLVYDTLGKMQSCYPAMWHIVEYMNRPTDLSARKCMATARMSIFQQRMVEKQAQGFVGFLVDELDITFEDVEFLYCLRSPSRDGALFQRLNLTVKQGEMLAVLVGAGVGAKTMGRLLNGTLLPTHGDVFVPPHLRTLFVGLDALIWDGPIIQTLFFGLMARRLISNVEELEEHELERGKSICKRLNVPSVVMRDIESSLDDLHGRVVRSASTKSGIERAKSHDRLSESTVCKIQLACALITDPEVLVVNKPLQKLTPDCAKSAMLLLQEYVEYRGAERDRDSEMIASRRPRTCVITSSSTLMLSGVDRVVLVKPGGVLEELDTDQLAHTSSAMLGSFSEDVCAFKKSHRNRTLSAFPET